MTNIQAKVAEKLQTFSYDSRLYIAYSGGMDSSVLLHAIASITPKKSRITAVYINHGLLQAAHAWSIHCEGVCKKLDVNFLPLSVNAQAKTGESPEEAARNARYRALKPLLEKDDLLLLGQHSDDQIETVLLQLFRGCGLKGLAGMPFKMPFGQGTLVRPLLDVSKAELIDYAERHTINWIEDPSNQDAQFDRNFLRHAIIPQIKQRWPSLDRTISRSAHHCGDAQTHIEMLGKSLLEQVLDHGDGTLLIAHLQELAQLEQHWVIRQWFEYLGLRMPSQQAVRRILQEVVLAKEEAEPVVQKRGYSIRRYRKKLYCVTDFPNKTSQVFIWPAKQKNVLVSDNIRYQIIDSNQGILVDLWNNAEVSVKFRAGGETIRLPGRVGHHALKKLYQEAGIPPWEREQIPLIYIDDKLAAVGELWVSAEFYSNQSENCYQIIHQKIVPKGNDEEGDVD